MGFVLLSILLGFSSLVHAVVIPKQLSRDDRKEVIRMLGLSTSTKILSNPFPLGGYSGFEVGLSVELIDVSDLPKLGCQAGSVGCPNTGLGDKDLQFPRLSIGKGLYNNIDVFLHFAPQHSGSSVTSFGGAVRYSFYEARFLPFNMSLVLNADHVNVGDEFQATTIGADLISGIYVNNFSLYFGVGQLRSSGTFIAGLDTSDATVEPTDPDVDGATNTVEQSVSQTHSLAGITIHIREVFLAAQVDRYPEPSYSFRAGLRF